MNRNRHRRSPGIALQCATALLVAALWPAWLRAEYPTYPPVGSTYLPIEHWAYAALGRLAALGYVQSGMLGLRPWTRTECARLVEEAGELLRNDWEEAPEARRLQRVLEGEFDAELRAFAEHRARRVALESVYTRVTAVSGTPLTDGFHFGQTLVNDYGRPYQRGLNLLTGFAASAATGRLGFYFRGEFQHAPAAPALSPAARAEIPRLDAGPFPAVDRFRVLDAYASIHLRGYQVSFGRQSLWWGPSQSGPLIFSANAEPPLLLRISRVAPFKFPHLLDRLGPVRTEFFIGQLRGHSHINLRTRILEPPISPQPFVHGGKISFKPTPNLEFGFSVTTIWGGDGTPTNLRTFLRSFSLGNEILGETADPGDRRSGFDFSYRIPGIRDWLVLYVDSLVEDEFSPIAYPRKSAMHPGIYMPRLPGLAKVDFRAEAFYTDVPGFGPAAFYTNGRYLSGYTNAGQLMGHWIGRQGKGVHLASTYWASPQSFVHVSYRSAKLSRQLLTGGGTQHNLGIRAEWLLRPDVSFSAHAQYEQWKIPLLAPGLQRNMTTSFQLTYRPPWKVE